MKTMDHEKPTLPIAYIILGILFSVTLIVANLAAQKILHIGHLVIDAGTIIFPLIYLILNLLVEKYGPKPTQRIIWCAQAGLLIAFLLYYVLVFLPTSETYTLQAGYRQIFLTEPRIIFASSLASTIGALINTAALDHMKRKRWFHNSLYLRFICSSIIGELFDTTLFCFIAFFHFSQLTLWDVVIIGASEYSSKIVFEALYTLAGYRLIIYLVKRVL